jgi:hypothetical protein
MTPPTLHDDIQHAPEPRLVRLADVAATPLGPDRPGTRQWLFRGLAGIYSQVISMPPGRVVPAHSHALDEVMYFLAGSITTLDSADPIRAPSALYIPARYVYGFTVGDAGVQFLLLRTGHASNTHKSDPGPGKVGT